MAGLLVDAALEGPLDLISWPHPPQKFPPLFASPHSPQNLLAEAEEEDDEGAAGEARTGLLGAALEPPLDFPVLERVPAPPPYPAQKGARQRGRRWLEMKRTKRRRGKTKGGAGDRTRNQSHGTHHNPNRHGRTEWRRGKGQ